jgi:hypothetical protein
MSTSAGSGTVGYSAVRPVVVLDGSGVGVMIVDGGFAVADVIVSCGFAQRCMILRDAVAGMLRSCATP